MDAAWVEREGALHRRFTFADFDEAFAFMVQVAEIARRLDHHPDWSNSWNVVDISVTSHDVGHLTARDRRFVEAVDRLR